ncbi:hypothetical protein ACFOG5_13190 [Pedobacter fastidiosus]|uniref:Uncharacterized protein n=1 Tax=Pedobacter fastidiosus TaxID=2765361 RepID=A0ABR7KLQ4_9SPHI|nr:hypothetical protein [Pedobacter fastidiosus]MBC6109011.1 hypothetical protein [Pedobacter fastidiosus]
MKFLKKVDWWSLLREIVIPHLGTVILYAVIFFLIGIICGIFYNLILWKKKIYVRKPKYYNWAVKLYIVASMGVFIYFPIHLALIFAAKDILKKEEPRIVAQLYEQIASITFETPALRQKFIQKIQSGATEIQQGTKNTAISLNEYIAKKNTGIHLVDNSKNKLSAYLVDKYKEDIYSASMYGMLLAAGKGHVQIEDLSYTDLKAIVATLNSLEPKTIEQSIKIKLTEKVDEILSEKINRLIKGNFILFFALLLIPIIEFFIYGLFMKRQSNKGLNTVSSKDGIANPV